MTTQTQAQKYAAIAEWDRAHRPANLAETDYNRDLIGTTLATQYGGEITVEILNRVMQVLHDRLQWLAVPSTPPAAQRRDIWNTLINLGVQPWQRTSSLEQERADREREKQRHDQLDEVAIRNERNSLYKQFRDAELTTIQVEKGPYAGRIDHAASQREREKRLSSVKQLITVFNQKYPQHALEV